MTGIPTFKKKFEIVERKGIGHPDTICDLVMNQISIELSRLYLKETGIIQHHNMDKALLVAGQTEVAFGGGKVTKPMKLILGDRATSEINGMELPVGEFAIEAAKKWFAKNLRFVKDEHIQYQIEIGKTSRELRTIFKSTESFVSNDTSVLVGYAPYTKCETTVLETEEFINSPEFKRQFPESGEDVKVMGFRKENSLDLIIAIAFVDRYIDSERKYFERKKEILNTINEFQREKETFDNVEIQINKLDSEKKGVDGVYLTVLGTSADNADSGQVGRGNLASRVISPFRPASAEAVAGKNPVSHIGKIYSTLSFSLAQEIHKTIPSFDEVFVWMYNVIGNDVNRPKAIIVQPVIEQKKSFGRAEEVLIEEILEKNLTHLDEFCKRLINTDIQIA